MNGDNILLDTNIIIEIFGGNKVFADRLNKIKTFYIRSVVLGELYVGVNRAMNKAKHLKMLSQFLTLGTILLIDEVTAKYYGETVAYLYKKGKPIPSNDVWIAALAEQHAFTLITRDRHFKEIEKLKLQSW